MLTFEVKEVTFPSADRLALANDDRRNDLLPQLGLALLDGCEEQITDRAGWVPVKTSASVSARDHVQVFGSGVVCAVHD